MRASELHRLARTLREVALLATRNTGDERVNAGELAVLEDVARHPRCTVGDITGRTGLAQSLVSRIVRAMADAGTLTIDPDQADRRKVRIDLTTGVRTQIMERASASVTDALAVSTPALTAPEREALERHLSAAYALLDRAAGTSS